MFFKINALTILLLAIGFQVSVFAEKITIKGLDIEYNEITQIMVASGNAELNHPDFTILADSIVYDKSSGIILGQNNVELLQGNQIILSNTFSYNTTNNVIKINDLRLELSTKNKNQAIYSFADSFEDKGNRKDGKNGILTTCNYDPPHYYFKAKSFTIYPEKRIIAQNVTFVNPIFFLPFGFWSPAYVIDIGKRKVIYLMPVIGSNSIEGSFVKNQVDYVINDNLTGIAYVDYLSRKGIGLGTRLNYNNLNDYSTDIYYYGVSDSENNIREWNQEINISDQETLKTYINSKNMYLIQGGNSKSDKHSIEFEKESINNRQKIGYEFTKNQLSTLSPKTYKINFSKNYDDNSSINANYNRSETSVVSDEINFSNNNKIGHDVSNKNTISYYQKELSSTDDRKDSYLKTSHIIDKKIDNIGQLSTTFDFYFDTDDDTVTTDIRNHIVQKTPEINLNLNSQKLTNEWSLNQTLQYGYYSEQYYINSLDEQRNYSQSRITLKQNLLGNYNYNFLNGKLTFNTTYEQYYYASGDQTFTLSNTTTYTTNSFSFLKTNTSHQRSWIPENGNTPFYFDERSIQEKNNLKETITLYYLSDTKYAFKYSSGYNWILDYQLDNMYELLINPKPTFKSIFKTTYLLQQHMYSPLVSQFEYKPSSMFSTTLQVNYDLNEGEIINLNHILSGTTSTQWKNRWIFRAYFTYAPSNNQNYQLQTLSLTKDLHERKLTLLYNRLLEEYRFQFTINAFPENQFGFTKNKFEDFRVEGVLDDNSIQR